MTKLRIIVGLSGGVDSSVSAYLLKKQGHHVEAIFMKNWEGEDDTNCPAAIDFDYAQRVCETLAIPLSMVNFSNDYWERVFSYFLDEYRAGRTPNPDILCNKEIKFRAFLDYAKQQGADLIATGHYVRRQHDQLLKGIDTNKDQSYFLYALNREQLTNSLFPIGELTKPQVREIATELKLASHDKKDSTGICFIGERKFKSFLTNYLPAQPGSIKTLNGETIGQHDGLMFYTIGQRQGLHIGGCKGKLEAPWFVAEKDLKNNCLIVVQGDHPALYKKTLVVNDIHWINAIPNFKKPLNAKIRYRQKDQICFIEPCEDNLLTKKYNIHFNCPQRAVTPGQSIVFYQDDICLGGGIIS